MKCNRCGIEQPETSFGRNRKRLSTFCRTCDAVRCRSYYQRNAEKRRKWARDNYKRYDKVKKERTRGTLKDKARRTLRDAIKLGRMVKPNICDDCRELLSASRLHGHHEDYSNPLEVLWLCAACHAKRHRKYLAQQGDKP